MHPFGRSAFDRFVIERWDASSPLCKNEQFRSLVATWIELGEFARNQYAWTNRPTSIPGYVPQDLVSTSRTWIMAHESVYWVRTWYGNEDEGGDGLETVTRAKTDEAYRRLYKAAVMGIRTRDDGTEYQMYGPFEDQAPERDYIFDNDPTLYGVQQNDLDQSVVKAGEVPSFLTSVFMRYPDKMNDFTGYRRGLLEVDEEYDAELIWKPRMLFLIADRKACEEGWILYVVLNHKGQVLPMRCRDRACDTRENIRTWPEFLDCVDHEGWEKEEEYIYGFGPGGGWVGETVYLNDGGQRVERVLML